MSKKTKQHIALMSGNIIVPKTITNTRKDIADWKAAISYTRMEPARWHALQLIYEDIRLDAMFSSQYGNRTLKALSKQLVLRKPDGSIDEEQTAKINQSRLMDQINRHILDSRFYGYSLIELIPGAQEPGVALIPRTNVDPVSGLLYPDVYADKTIAYRQLPQYGKTVLEFADPADYYGLMNRLVPHILFKRFAQSAWSELCEIYGIPPRVLKTDTQDPKALARGREMMENFGAAAWMIIDEHEEFHFASGVSTNGDVYRNLIQLCNNEISMLISGAIIGQDTVNGSRAKDESAKDMLRILVQNDLRLIERYWNTTVIPALKYLGYLTGDVVATYTEDEDLTRLWDMTVQALPYFEVDPEWLRTKFGIQITGKRAEQSLQAPDDDFFV